MLIKGWGIPEHGMLGRGISSINGEGDNIEETVTRDIYTSVGSDAIL